MRRKQTLQQVLQRKRQQAEEAMINQASISPSTGRSQEVADGFDRLADYVATLPLDRNQLKRLADLTAAPLKQAEHDAFLYGFNMALQLMKSMENEKKGARQI